jgi:hypothetical protein
LTTTPTSLPASCANISANGASGRSARLGAAAGWLAPGDAGCCAGLGAAGGRIGFGVAGASCGGTGAGAAGAVGAAGCCARPDTAISAKTANDAATTAPRRRKTLTPFSPGGKARRAPLAMSYLALAFPARSI